MVEPIKDIQDEMQFSLSTKTKTSDVCWACGPLDSAEVGSPRYMISTSYWDEERVEQWDYLELCPKHMAFLLNMSLTHLMRVEKGKEAGPLNLPLLQEAGAQKAEGM